MITQHEGKKEPVLEKASAIEPMIATIGIISVSFAVSATMAILSLSMEIIKVFLFANIATAVISLACLNAKSRGASIVFALLPVPISLVIVFMMSSSHQAKMAQRVERNWNEEVAISNGEKIIVQRWEKGTWLDSEGQKNPGLLYESSRIEADLPGVGTLTWETTLSPYLLDIASDGKWYLVAAPLSSSFARDEYGLATPLSNEHNTQTFAIYRLEKSTWRRIGHNEFPAEFKKPNLLLYSNREFKFEVQQKINRNGWEDAVASELPDLQVKVARNDIHTSYPRRTIPDLHSQKSGT